ncbi:MAG: hypothetical protein HJJLKODD_00233 [Phycisphaerae bacterium]|nr:hypothetical protein [Phycisphaerae bacterium]
MTCKLITMAVTTVLLLGWAASAPGQDFARGVVYEDRNRNGQRDDGEPGLNQIGVSNGREVVTTDAEGRYELPVDQDEVIFVIKPRDYRPPLNPLNLFRFYQVHKPGGSPDDLHFAGVAPTGPLPAAINFPLVYQAEPEEFEVLLLGDTQPDTLQDIHYLARDVLPELIGTQAEFGVTLGDVVNDHLDLYEPYNEVMSHVGIPWINVHGNHDENYDVEQDALADETWERVFGPATYSFNWGPIHFIVVDDVLYQGHEKEGKYSCAFGPYLPFIENDLKLVPVDTTVVLMMHIPMMEAADKQELFKLLQDRPHVLSLSAHWHQQSHFFLSAADGWLGKRPHHHVVVATACGSWWEGALDERGIPHATMYDGAPNGYLIGKFSRTDYSLRYKAARRPADEQMSIWAPDEIRQDQIADGEIIANIYFGSERSTVEMQVGRGATWSPMTQITRIDPYFQAVYDRELAKPTREDGKLPKPRETAHLWQGRFPEGLAVGSYLLTIRTRDLFGQVYEGHHILKVLPTE